MNEYSQSGNSDFSDVPDWYKPAPPPPPAGAPTTSGAPAAPLAPAPPAGRGRKTRSPLASAEDPYFNSNGQGGHQPLYNPVAQGVPHATSNGGGRGVGRFLGGAAMKIGIVVIFLGGGFLFTLGTTSAEALVEGDCFVMVDTIEVDRVDTTDCNDTHDSQVLGLVTVQGPTEYPSMADPYWESVFSQCDGVASSVLTNLDEIPFDAQIELFTPLEGEWDRGGRESICIMHSPTGLPRSFVGTE